MSLNFIRKLVFPTGPGFDSDDPFPEQEATELQEQAAVLLDIKKKSVRGATSYFIRTGVLQAIGFIAAAILSAYLSAEDYGIYGLVVQVVGILTFVSDIGMAAALVQKKSTPAVVEYRAAFTVQQLLSWCIVLITLGIALIPGFREKAGTDGLWILVAMGVSFPLATLKTIPSVLLERKLDFSKLVIPQLLEQVVFQSSLVFFVVSGWGVISYAYAIMLRSIVGAISMMFLQPWEFGFSLDREALRGLLGYGVKFQLNDFLARIKDQLFYLVLAVFLPAREFGYITWAKQWSMYPYNLTVQNVMSVTFPAFSRLQSHREALQKAIEKSLFFITLVIFPILAGMVIFIQPLLEVFPVYQKWYPAVTSLILFSLGIGWSAVSTPLTNTLNAVGQINTTLKLMVMWTVLTWVLTPLAIVWFGYTGVALVSFIIAFTSLLPAYYVKKIVPIRFADAIWRQAIAAGFMLIVGQLGKAYWQQGISQLLLGGVVVSVTYLVAVTIIGRDKLKRELQSLR